MRHSKLHKTFGVIAFVICFLPCVRLSASSIGYSYTYKPEFIRNKGQWPADIIYKLVLPEATVLFKQSQVVFMTVDANDSKKLSEFVHQYNTIFKGDSIKLKAHALFINYSGANEKAIVTGVKSASHYYNFFLGNNPNHWASGIFPESEITYHDFYPGIDLRWYFDSETHHLKYEFLVHPFANYNLIAWDYLGADVSQQYDELYIQTPYMLYKERKPFTYYQTKWGKREIEARYILNKQHISVVIENQPPSNAMFVIDPEMIFSTYSGSTVDNFGFTATHDSKGHLISGGITGDAFPNGSNPKYPTTPGAFSITYSGGSGSDNPSNMPCDITISKYTADGKQLICATYIGGQTNEFPHSLVADKNDNILILGTSNSADYPVSANAYDQLLNGSYDIIITKLNDSCTKLLGSTYIGGLNKDGLTTSTKLQYFYADDFRGDIIVDDTNNIYIASCTQSDNFPVSKKIAVKDTFIGPTEGLVAKFSEDLSVLKWSTFIGTTNLNNNSETGLYSIDFDKNNDLYISGGTGSTSFIGVTPGSYQPNNSGYLDGIIIHLSKDGRSILHATYFGTNKYDQIYNLELDNDGNVYVVGQSEGQVSITPNIYAVPNSGLFLAKFNAALNQKIWSTTFGNGNGKPNLTLNAFLVDDCNRIYVSGWGTEWARSRISGVSTDTFATTKGMRITNDAFQNITDGNDFYLMALAPDAQKLLYATYIGGLSISNSGDHVDGGTSRFDKKGVVYQSVCASCNDGAFVLSDFPTTSWSVYPINLSRRCSNAAFKFDMSLGEALFSFTLDSCTRQFTFINKTENSFNTYWDFGDGDSAKSDTAYHTYKKPGTYKVMMVSNPGKLCSDTAYKSITITDDFFKITIPNTFTPNQDGINDEFVVSGVNAVCDAFDIIIYNRWGNVYFQSKNPLQRWNGDNAPEGVYFYILTIKTSKGQEIKDHGTITLIRGN